MVDKKYDVKCLAVNICGLLLQVKKCSKLLIAAWPCDCRGTSRHTALLPSLLQVQASSCSSQGMADGPFALWYA